MKKVLSFVVAATLALSVAGCGGAKGGSGQPAAGSGSAQPAAKQEPVKIGYFGPLTGPSAQPGQALRNGTQIAIDEINAAGGISGRPLELVEYDDKSSPEQAVKGATKLIEQDKVSAMVASIHSGNILAAAPVIEENKVPTIGAGTATSWLSKGYKFLFRALANGDVSAEQLVKESKKLGLKRLAVLYQNDEYGKGGLKGVQDQAKAQGGIEVVASESYARDDRDFTGQFAKLLGQNPDGLVLWGLGEDLGAIVKQARQKGYNGLILGPEGFSLPQVKEVAGDAANKVIYIAQYIIPGTPDEAADPMMKKFLQAYKAKYNEMPKSDNAFRGYDAMRNIAEGMKRAGGVDKQKVRDQIQNLEGFQGLAGTFNYKGKNGEGITEMRAFAIQNGKDVPASELKK